jgi:hypothetical protein
VLALIAVAAALAAPRFASAGASYRVEMAARRVAADLTMARRYARVTSQRVTCAFDARNGQYRLGGVPDPNHPGREYAVELFADPLGVRLVGVELGSGGQVVFDPYGTPSAGGTIQLQAGDHTRTVTLDVNTGKAAVR